MKTMKGLLASLLLVSSVANATPSATGAFIGIFGGGSYSALKEYLREKGVARKDQTPLVNEHKNCFIAGAQFGYMRECCCGLCLGGRIDVYYNHATIKNDKGKFSNVDYVRQKDAQAVKVNGTYDIEAKPFLIYNANFMIGYKVAPCCVAYAKVGFGANHWLHTQYMEWDGTAAPVLFDIGSADKKESGTTLNIPVGLGVNYYVSERVFLSLEATANLHMPKKFHSQNEGLRSGFTTSAYYGLGVGLKF